MADIAAPAPASSGGGSSAPSTPAPVTATPATQGTEQGTPSPAASQPQSSEPPRERWDDILNNARTKTRAEVEAEYKQKYQHFEGFDHDPWQWMQGRLKEASGHSVYGPMVNQWAAQHLNSLKPRTPAEEPQPDVPIVDGNNQVTGYTYSAKQLKQWKDWDWAQKEAQINERFAPVEQRMQHMAQQEQYAQVMQDTNRTLTQLRAQPYFKEHEADIKQALTDHEEWGDNVHAAYNYVLVTKILPTLSQAERQQVITDLNTKAEANTVSPNSQAVQAPKFKSFASAMEYYAAHPDEAKAKAQR
jgi:hypothetical protein